MEIYANLLNGFFDKTMIQSMVSSIHKSYQVPSSQQQRMVLKLDVRNKNRVEVLQHCIVFDLDDAIEFLKEKCKEKNRHLQARKKWLKILQFAKKFHNDLESSQKNPTDEMFDTITSKPEYIQLVS